MPRTLYDAAGFLGGFWVALALLLPLGAPWSAAADPGLALLESRLHLAVNEFRRKQRLIALERRVDLDAVARAHSEDMVARGFFSHASPDGATWVERLAAAGRPGLLSPVTYRQSIMNMLESICRVFESINRADIRPLSCAVSVLT